VEIVVGLAGAIGALIGVIVGGVMTLVGGHLQSKHADRRLLQQLAHDARQREKERVLAYRMEPLERVGQVLEFTTEAIPAFVLAKREGTRVQEDIFDTYMTKLRRAEISMVAMGQGEIMDDLGSLRIAIQALMNSAGGEGAVDAVPAVTQALAQLERHYNAQKIRSILAN